jgi:hypothetical protein
LLSGPLTELGFSPAQIEQVITATGPRSQPRYGFTFSDLTQRLLPGIVLDAYPAKAVTPARAIEIAKNLEPTPPFEEKTV